MSLLTARIRNPVRQVLRTTTMDYADLRLFYSYVLYHQAEIYNYPVYRLIAWLQDTVIVIKIGNKL